MIIRHRILEKVDNYKFSFPYKTGDTVLVETGQKVLDGTDLLKKKESTIKHSFYLPQQLGIDMKQALDFLTCTDGEYVSQGDILAERVVAGGFSVRKLIAPVQGVVDLSRLDSGFLDLLGEESELVVKSTFEGSVESVSAIEGISIVVDAYVLDLLAISDGNLRGNEKKELIGQFVSLGEGKDLLLSANDESYENKIVFVGKYLHADLLHDLFEKGALFVLTYSMDYEDFRKQGLPVGVIGGFGEIYSSNLLMNTISSLNGKYGIVNYSENQVFFLTKSTKVGVGESVFVKSAVGSTVLSRSLSNYGMLGKIVDIEEDGIYLTVSWEGGAQSIIHIGNVEFISF